MMPADTQPRRLHITPIHAGLCVVLLVAALLRTTRLDLMAFEMDEGVACIYAVRYAHYGLFPLLGVKTSLGFYNTPLLPCLLAPTFLITSDARFPALLLALLGTAAVYIVYRTGREFFSPAVGLTAAAMMAVSPAAVDYSRRLWGHSFIQILAAFAFYFLLRWIMAGRAKAVFWLALIVTMAQQMHFSGALLWVPILLALAVFRPRTDWVGLLLGVLLGALSYLPFVHEQFHTDFSDLRRIAELTFRGTEQPAPFSLRPLAYWAFAATDLGRNNFLQDDYAGFLDRIHLYRVTRAAMSAAWMASLVAAAAWAAVELRGKRVGRALAERTAARPLLFVAWAVVPLAVFLLLRVPVVAPYFLVVYPVPFLAVAWATAGFCRWVESRAQPPAFRRAVQMAAVIAVGLWAAHQILHHVVFRQELDLHGGGSGSYVSYGWQREAMRFIAHHAPGRTVVVSEEHRDPARGIDFRYLFLLWTFDHNTERFSPADQPGRRPANSLEFYNAKADYWYVIRNRKFRVRDDFEEFLKAFPFRQFGRLRVVVIPRPGPWPRFGPGT